jgi:hypothetical protein
MSQEYEVNNVSFLAIEIQDFHVHGLSRAFLFRGFRLWLVAILVTIAPTAFHRLRRRKPSTFLLLQFCL